MITRKAHRLNVWLPLCGLAGATLLLLPKTVFGDDIGIFLITALTAALICLALILIFFQNVRHRTAEAFSMLIIFSMASWLLFRFSDGMRYAGRWLIHSSTYKSEVAARPAPPTGMLKHIEWDGWGFAGAGDTVVYLVYDPSNSLRLAVKSHSAGRFSGIPCEVPEVRKLESHWYTVLFYTDTNWDHCR